MMKPHPTKRAASGAPGVKALITAASLAVTVGGWAAIARSQPAPDAQVDPAPVADLAVQRPLADLNLSMAPLPTVVPLSAPAPEIAVARPPSLPADLMSNSAPAAPAAAPRQAAPAAAPVAQAPVAQVPAAQPLPAVAAPALRAVSAPPKPVARTRSSR